MHRTRDEWEREAINCRRGEASRAYGAAVLDVLTLYAQVDRLKVENAALKVEYDKLDQAWLNAEGEIETLKAQAAERDWQSIAEDLAESIERIQREKQPAYHDCIDNGEPECAWCEAHAALERFRAERDML